MICKHEWQQYGVCEVISRYDEYSQFWVDGYIEHFRACKKCGRIEQRRHLKKWEEV